MKPALYCPQDLGDMLQAGACACGHAALAAAMSRDVLAIFRPFIGCGLWVNEDRMKCAITALGGNWRQVKPGSVQAMSLRLIQGVGSWMKVNAGARNARTHWVASCWEIGQGRLIYDVNIGDWLPYEVWKSEVLDEILLKWKAKEWHIRTELVVNAPL